ncbi:MAG TPA: type II toxin-antitoxin system PemK/MazF family toxin [Chlamydiales bacterium]|nr:type II toxin-antitoxin system PemK/MazF family toxin [Chlamydiales bacterium]
MVTKTECPQRGAVYWVDLDPATGVETKKRRPCVILSNNTVNEASDIITIAPITSKKLTKIRSVEVQSAVGGRNGKIMLNQSRAIGKERLQNQMVSVDPETMSKVDRALKIVFDLSPTSQGGIERVAQSAHSKKTQAIQSNQQDNKGHLLHPDLMKRVWKCYFQAMNTISYWAAQINTRWIEQMVTKNEPLRRGDVYWVGLDDPATGVKKTRPCLILANHRVNESPQLLMVAPLRLTGEMATIRPFEVQSTINGLDGKIMLDQCRAIDRKRLQMRITPMDSEKMEQVEGALKIVFNPPQQSSRSKPEQQVRKKGVFFPGFMGTIRQKWNKWKMR